MAMLTFKTISLRPCDCELHATASEACNKTNTTQQKKKKRSQKKQNPRPNRTLRSPSGFENIFMLQAYSLLATRNPNRPYIIEQI